MWYLDLRVLFAMDSKTKEIIQKLQGCKQEGLTYYQAAQKLLAQGYSQMQIDDAENTFNYNKTQNMDTKLAEISTTSGKPSMFTQSYISTGEMYQSKYSRPALLILVVILTLGVVVALLTGLI